MIITNIHALNQRRDRIIIPVKLSFCIILLLFLRINNT